MYGVIFTILKDPNGNKPFLGLSWAILGIVSYLIL